MRNALAGVVVGVALGIVGAGWAGPPGESWANRWDREREEARVREAEREASDPVYAAEKAAMIAAREAETEARRQQEDRDEAEAALAGDRERIEYCSIVLSGSSVTSTCADVNPDGDTQGNAVNMAGRRGWKMMDLPTVDHGWLWTTREFWFERERVVP